MLKNRLNGDGLITMKKEIVTIIKRTGLKSLQETKRRRNRIPFINKNNRSEKTIKKSRNHTNSIWIENLRKRILHEFTETLSKILRTLGFQLLSYLFFVVRTTNLLKLTRIIKGVT